MRTTERRRRSGREFRVEGLESRALLSAGLPAQPAAAVRSIHAENVLVVHGQVHGTATPISPATASPMLFAASGQGTAGRYGRINFSTQYFLTLPLGTSKTGLIPGGTASVTSPRFGEGDVAYNGTATFVTVRRARISLSGEVTRAVGPFAGSTGTFIANGILDPVTGRIRLNFTLTLNTRI